MKTCCDYTGFDCRQGRDCPARLNQREGGETVDAPPVTAESTVNLFALLVWLTALLTIAFLGAFVVGVGYAVWPVLRAALS